MLSLSVQNASKKLTYQIADVKTCADEPIAFCGAIQPSGLMIVARCSDLKILAVSENWSKARYGHATSDLLGKPIYDIFDIEGLQTAGLAPDQPLEKEKIENLFINESISIQLKIPSTEKLENGFCHRQGELFIVEFDLQPDAFASSSVAFIKELVHRMKIADSVEMACQKTAETGKTFSGFDRVMIYRFDDEWNGEVVAEAKNENLTPFLNLKYPSTDIPPQARALFSQNKVRMICDTSAEALALINDGANLRDLDLGLTLFRAVSPIHLQYMENMGVRASFAAPIKVNDKLWGLVACHNYAGPKHPSHEIRTAFELATQILSGKVGDLIARRRLETKTRALEFVQTLLGVVAQGKDPLRSFEVSVDTLLTMTSSTSVIIKLGDETLLLGEPLPSKTVDALLKRLRKENSLTVWKSDSLKRDLKLTESSPVAAGALAVPLALGFEDMLIWVRPSEDFEVKWAGQQKDPEALRNSTSRELLTPRSSFSEWAESVRDRCQPWTEADEDCGQYLLFGFVQGIFAQAQTLSLAYKELEQAAKAKDIFIGTISHELRTPLSIIIGWIDILKDYPQSAPEATEAIEIIERNAKSQIVLINDLLDVSRIISGKLRLELADGVGVAFLITDIMSGLRPSILAKNITIEWEASNPVVVTADIDRLRQILWNLLNNAVKFTPKNGTVSVVVKSNSTSLVVEISDTGIGIDSMHINAIFETFSQENASAKRSGGLGLGLAIVKTLVELHGGRVEAHSAGRDQGSKFTLHLPIYKKPKNAVLAAEHEAAETPPQTDLLDGVKILVAEDQPDALRALQIMLERNGAVVTTAENGAEALAALSIKDFDLILSDIEMPEIDGYQLIKAWRDEEANRNKAPTPAIALTAFASSQSRTKVLAAGFQSHIPKPIDKQELLAVIASLGIKATKKLHKR